MLQLNRMDLCVSLQYNYIIASMICLKDFWRVKGAKNTRESAGVGDDFDAEECN